MPTGDLEEHSKAQKAKDNLNEDKSLQHKDAGETQKTKYEAPLVCNKSLIYSISQSLGMEPSNLVSLLMVYFQILNRAFSFARSQSPNKLS